MSDTVNVSLDEYLQSKEKALKFSKVVDILADVTIKYTPAYKVYEYSGLHSGGVPYIDLEAYDMEKLILKLKGAIK